MAPKVLRAKKKCCDSTPRCSTCPIVLSRLAKAGYAVSVDSDRGGGRRSFALVKAPDGVKRASHEKALKKATRKARRG